MRRVDVADLHPGMSTPDWIVRSEPRYDKAGGVVRIDMEHRIDHGWSTIEYDAGTRVQIEEDA